MNLPIKDITHEFYLFVAYRILQSLNTSVNPCQNFQQFVCGGWEKRAIVSKRRYFQRMIKSGGIKITTLLKNLLEQPEKSTDTYATKQSKRLYASCIYQNHTESHKITQLSSAAEAVNGLPIITDNYNVSQLSLEDFYSSAAMYSSIVYFKPFTFAIDVNVNNSATYILKV